MRGIFDFCRTLTTIDVSNFDTSKNTNMYYMFSYLTLTEIKVKIHNN